MELTQEQLREQTRSMRRACSRIGVALLLSLGLSYVGIFVLNMLLLLVNPWLLSSYTALLALSDLCTYGIGALVLWAMLLPLPIAWPAERGLTPGRFGRLALESVGLLYSVSLLTTLALLLISSLLGQELGDLLSDTLEGLSLPAMFLFMVVIAPLCEELMFRKLLLRKLLPMGEGFAIVLSALAFGLFHCNLEQFFYATALGLLFATVVIKTGRLRYTILLHALVNFVGSVLATAVEVDETATTIFILAIYLFMALGLLVLFRDRKKLLPQSPSLPHCYLAAFTAPGWLVYVLGLSVLSLLVLILYI